MLASRRTAELIAVAVLLAPAGTRAPAAASGSCDALSTLVLPADTVILTAATRASAVCRVVGRVQPSITFEVWLPSPAAWNGKFEGIGNSGVNGAINRPALEAAVARGYAAAATDLGHTSGPFDSSWALGRPDLVVDWGHRATHEVTDRAKAIVKAFYGREARRAYFVGCSGGGRQGLMEAQRYPGDYDGIVAGAPTNFFTHLTASRLWIARATLEDPASYIPAEKIPAIAHAVVAACDREDGLADGVLDDPRRCRFDPAVLRCAAQDTPACLTTPQVEALQRIYAGPRTSAGTQIFPGLMPGGEQPPGGGWLDPITGRKPFDGYQYVYSNSFFQNMVFEDRTWDYRTFDFDRDVAATDRKLASIINATSPDLREFRDRGGKLIQYHGWSDAGVAPLNSVNYYDEVVEAMGGDLRETQQFYRLFMVPGMQHCTGGPGTDRFDGLAALDAWVDRSVAPDRIPASHLANDTVTRTRPLCPYPQVARWSGSGSPNEAQNFTCAAPAGAR